MAAAGGRGEHGVAQMDVEGILSGLTLEEKASLLAGSSFWHTRSIPGKGVPSIVLTDGSHGLRKQVGEADHLGLNDSVPATAFPTASATACSFDEQLVEMIGEALGEECRKEDVAVLLAPGMNIKRSPLCGRNFEYFSEDPLLTGKLAAAMVRGVQSRGVGACPKHLCANNQELARLVSDSLVDDRALNEIYLKAFEMVVREARPWAIMVAYNKLNGVHCTEDRELLQDKLRGEWGFDGLVVTDWGAIASYDDSLPAGLDLVMPGPEGDYPIHIAREVREGRMQEADVDRAVARILELLERSRVGAESPCACDMDAHLELAYRAACESAVLLDNDGTLPLDPSSRIALVGEFARTPRYQGAGSSRVNPIDLDCLVDALAESGVRFEFVPGYDVRTGETTDEQVARAAEAARRSDVAVVMVGLPEEYESEGFDRTDMAMPAGHVRLVEEVCRANPRTVVVLSGGSPMELAWDCRPAAVLLAHLAGCRGGAATRDLLLGRANPCGKLAETWPARLEDTALGSSFPERTHQVRYIESIFVGYRYFDAAGIVPAYPFGHGLSYTAFEYENLSVKPDAEGLRVSLDVRNVGERAGAEVVQVYVGACAPVEFMPPRQLAAFRRIELEPGQTGRVEMTLGSDAFAHWGGEGWLASVGADGKAAAGWRVDAGEYEISACASSRDVRLTARVALRAGDAPFPVAEPAAVSSERRAELAAYYEVHPGGFDSDSLAPLYGRAYPEPAPLKPYTLESVLPDMKHNGIGRKVWRVLRHHILKTSSQSDKDTHAMTLAMIEHMPLRMMTMGGPPRSLVDSLIHFMNSEHGTGFNLLFQSLRKMLLHR